MGRISVQQQSAERNLFISESTLGEAGMRRRQKGNIRNLPVGAGDMEGSSFQTVEQAGVLVGLVCLPTKLISTT